MAKLNVKNGTPLGNTPLCRNCTWGQIMTGYRESEIMVICTNTSPNMRVPFVIHECTEFSDKHRPDWQQMEKLAIEVAPVRISKGTRGFSIMEPAADEEDEAVAAIAR